MNKNEFKTLMISWGKLSESGIDPVIDKLTKKEMDSDLVGGSLIAVMGVHLNLSLDEAKLLGDMSLETIDITANPLSPVESLSFSELMGGTIGWNTINGYLNFRESVGRVLERTRINTIIELKSVYIEIHGENPMGIISAVSMVDGRTMYFKFTTNGIPIHREGMLRVCSLDILSLRGIGYLIDAHSAIKA